MLENVTPTQWHWTYGCYCIWLIATSILFLWSFQFMVNKNMGTNKHNGDGNTRQRRRQRILVRNMHQWSNEWCLAPTADRERRREKKTPKYVVVQLAIDMIMYLFLWHNNEQCAIFIVIRNNKKCCVCVCSRERVLRCEGVKTNAFFQIYSEWNSKSSLTEHNMCAMGNGSGPNNNNGVNDSAWINERGNMDGIRMAENHAANTTIKWEKRVMNNNTIFNMHRNWDVTCRARHTLHENDLLPFVYVILYARISSSVWVQPKKKKQQLYSVHNTHFVWHWNAAGGV